MKLPNTDRAVISQQKTHDYLLSPSHPIGGFKAIIFNELGFFQYNWQLLQSDLKALLANDAIERETTEYGTKYEIRGNIIGPSEKSLSIVTAWIIRIDEDFPRFITAYPGD